MTAAPDVETTRAQLYLYMALGNLLLAFVGVGLMVWIFLVDSGVRTEIVQQRTADRVCSQRTIVAPPPPMVDPETEKIVPPQDRPKDGYFGSQGTDIRPALRLTFEAVRGGKPPATPLERLPLYSQEVLPARKIHVVNLWATWCEPCRDEMPDFKAMFARNAVWAGDVRFLPIQVQDATEPGKAYSEIERIMPTAPLRLADRARNDPLATLLASDVDRKLFRGGLPVTLVLDCNRRVRWGHFQQLNEADFDDLERVVEQLRAELDDTRPGGWCNQEWPGNGRCEGAESTAAGHVLEDCGELKRRPQDGEPAPELIPATPTGDCPEGGELQPDGSCKRKLRGTYGTGKPNKPLVLATCGNGDCDGREDPDNCCEDCACEEPLMCKDAGGGRKRCMMGLLGR